MGQVELEADVEEQQHDPELRQHREDRPPVDEVEYRGADDDPGGDLADDDREPDALGQLGGHLGGHEDHQEIEEDVAGARDGDG